MRTRTEPTTVDLLRRFRMLRSAPEAALERMAAAVDVVDLGAGQHLTIQGRLARGVYFLIEGRAVAERDGTPVAALGPGDLVADVTGLHGAVRGATVQAVTPMRVLVARPEAIGALLDAFADAVDAVIAAAVGGPRRHRSRPALHLVPAAR